MRFAILAACLALAAATPPPVEAATSPPDTVTVKQPTLSEESPSMINGAIVIPQGMQVELEPGDKLVADHTGFYLLRHGMRVRLKQPPDPERQVISAMPRVTEAYLMGSTDRAKSLYQNAMRSSDVLTRQRLQALADDLDEWTRELPDPPKRE